MRPAASHRGKAKLLDDRDDAVGAEVAYPRSRMVHQEAPNAIICVADPARMHGVGCQQQPRIFDAAGGDHSHLCLNGRSYAVKRADLDGLKATAIGREANSGGCGIQKHSDVIRAEGHELAAKPHYVEVIETRASELPVERVEAAAVETRLWLLKAEVHDLGRAPDERLQGLMFDRPSGVRYPGPFGEVDGIEGGRFAGPGMTRSPKRSASHAVGLLLVGPSGCARAMKRHALLLLSLGIGLAHTLEFRQEGVGRRLIQ